ncbi:MAG: hypothetical protein KC586_08520, partial [Myxococcales bacterium]|nr:hypothetical protein [Myxococcales bacterium]
ARGPWLGVGVGAGTALGLLLGLGLATWFPPTWPRVGADGSLEALEASPSTAHEGGAPYERSAADPSSRGIEAPPSAASSDRASNVGSEGSPDVGSQDVRRARLVEPSRGDDLSRAPETSAGGDVSDARGSDSERDGRPGIRATSTGPSTQPASRDVAGALVAERVLLDRARALIRESRASEALELLARHGREHRKGALLEEAAALRVRAHLAARDRARAEAALARLLADHPSSLHRTPLERALAALPADGSQAAEGAPSPETLQ